MLGYLFIYLLIGIVFSTYLAQRNYGGLGDYYVMITVTWPWWMIVVAFLLVGEAWVHRKGKKPCK